MTDLFDLEMRLDKILDVLKEMNDRFRLSSDPRWDTSKLILDELIKMNQRFEYSSEPDTKQNTC